MDQTGSSQGSPTFSSRDTVLISLSLDCSTDLWPSLVCVRLTCFDRLADTSSSGWTPSSIESAASWLAREIIDRARSRCVSSFCVFSEDMLRTTDRRESRVFCWSSVSSISGSLSWIFSSFLGVGLVTSLVLFWDWLVSSSFLGFGLGTFLVSFWGWLVSFSTFGFGLGIFCLLSISGCRLCVSVSWTIWLVSCLVLGVAKACLGAVGGLESGACCRFFLTGDFYRNAKSYWVILASKYTHCMVLF